MLLPTGAGDAAGVELSSMIGHRRRSRRARRRPAPLPGRFDLDHLLNDVWRPANVEVAASWQMIARRSSRGNARPPRSQDRTWNAGGAPAAGDTAALIWGRSLASSASARATVAAA